MYWQEDVFLARRNLLQTMQVGYDLKKIQAEQIEILPRVLEADAETPKMTTNISDIWLSIHSHISDIWLSIHSLTAGAWATERHSQRSPGQPFASVSRCSPLAT